MDFGHGGDATRRQQVDHVARADFGRTEVDGMLATIGKVAIAVAAGNGDNNGSQAPKAIERRQRGQRTGENKVWRDIATGGPREAVVNPRGCLDGKGVERRRKAGGREQNASGGEDDAEEALGV
jgi:hypothetical protein